MLLLLVIVLYIFGFISSAATKAKYKKSAKEKSETLADMAAPITNAPVSNSSEDNDEIIAVISAAVSALYSGKKVKPVIKSIKNSSTRRSAWAKAGISENTRVF